MPRKVDMDARQPRCDAWNKRNPVGAEVRVTLDDRSRVDAVTTSAAWVLGDGTGNRRRGQGEQLTVSVNRLLDTLRAEDCAHDNPPVDVDPHVSRCPDCGMTFAYCHGCSTDAGSVYHAPPACAPCPTHGTRDCSTTTTPEPQGEAA